MGKNNAKPAAEETKKPAAASSKPAVVEQDPEVEVEADQDPEDEAAPINIIVDDKNIPVVIDPSTGSVQRGLKKIHFKEGIEKEDMKTAKRRFLEYMHAVYAERLADFDLSNDPDKKLELEIKRLEEKLAKKRAESAAKK